MELLNDRFWPCSRLYKAYMAVYWVHNRVDRDQFWPKSSHDFFTTIKDYIKYNPLGWEIEAWKVRENTHDRLLALYSLSMRIHLRAFLPMTSTSGR